MQHKQLALTVMSALLALSWTSVASNPIKANYGDKGSLNAFPDHTLPVLVKVSSKGQVTDIDPAYELSPGLDRMVEETVSRMISKPAVDKNGTPIPSQFVLNLAVDASQRSDGSFDTALRYVSTQPVPSGQWTWSHVEGRSLALIDKSRAKDDGDAPVFSLRPPPSLPPQTPNPQPPPATP